MGRSRRDPMECPVTPPRGLVGPTYFPTVICDNMHGASLAGGLPEALASRVFTWGQLQR